MAADASNHPETPPADEATGGVGEGTANDRRAGARPRPAVTIDLTAEEVPPTPRAAAAEPAAAEIENADPTAEAAAKTDRRRAFGRASTFGLDEGLRRTLLAGVAGGVLAVAVALILQWAGILPAPGRTAARQAQEQAKLVADQTAALDRRLAAVETMTEAIPAMRQDAKALSDAVTSLNALRPALASRGDLEALSASLAAMTKRLDSALPAATRDDLNAVAERVGRLEAAAAAGGDGQAISSAALSSLTSQLNQAQADVRALSDKVAAAEARAPAPMGADAMRAVAVASLRRASADGQPFAADVDMIANLGIGGGDIAIIRPLAVKGVATAADLAASFPAVADGVLAATTKADPNANIFQRAWAAVSGLVQVRQLGPVAGSDPGAIVSRMSDEVTKGDLAAALAERQALPEAGKAASAEWSAKATDRVALDQAVDRIAQAATAKSG